MNYEQEKKEYLRLTKLIDEYKEYPYEEAVKMAKRKLKYEGWVDNLPAKEKQDYKFAFENDKQS